MVRKINPRPGMLGRLHYVMGSEPEGWPRGAAVTVMECRERMVTVRAEDGRQVELPHWNVDVGHETEFEGVWLHESHPRVLAATSRLLRTLREQRTASGALDRDRLECIRNCEEQLLRYGVHA